MVVGADGRPEDEVQGLLKFMMPAAALRAFALGGARCVGRDVGAARQPESESILVSSYLTNREEAIAPFERATGRSLPRRAVPPPAAAAAPPPIPPAGFAVDPAPPSDLGAALVGRTMRYWWPEDGWQRGTGARL